MYSVIIAIVLLVVAVGAVLAARSIAGRSEDVRNDLPPVGLVRGVAAACFALAGLVLILSSITIVKAAEVGVPITFGKVGDPMASGVHLVAPWTKVESFPTRPFGVPDVKVVARTAQAGQVEAVVGARWHVVPERAAETYLQVRTGDEERISKEIVDKALGQAIGNVFATEDNMTATTNRVGVESDLVTELKRLVSPFGIAVDNVFLRSVEPDAKTADALARVASQQRATEIATESQQTAIEQAKANAYQAQGVKDAAEAIPNLTPEQVTALCAQAWERQQAKATEAGVPMYSSPCGSSTPVVAK